MKINILEQNYLFKQNKLFRIFFIFAVIYWYFLLINSGDKPAEYFIEHTKTIAIISGVFKVLTPLLVLLNMLLFRRVGTLTIENNIAILDKNAWVKRIDLDTVKKVKLKKRRKNEYTLFLDKTRLDLEILPSEIDNFKALVIKS